MLLKNIKKCIFLIILPILLCIGLVPGNANAATNTLTVSPPFQKMILVPGEVYKNSIIVSNASDSNVNLDYSVSVGSYSEYGEDGAKDDYGVVDHVSKSSYNQIMDWITFERESGTVEPGKTQSIPYTITVPENAPAGGQYATIIVKDETGSGMTGDGNIQIRSRFQFASIIYAEVSGETKKEGEISSNMIPSFFLENPLQATSMVKNNGNVHTDAEYTLQVWPLFSDEEICTNEEEPETSLILPETERYHAQTCDLPAIGIFRAKQVVEIFGEASIVEKVVIMCPLWLLFIIIFAIILAIVWLVTKSRNRRKETK